jgi:GNAT superfamily N-acetyltransferase
MTKNAGAIRVSSAHADVDRDLVYAFISTSYWAKDIPRETFERALASSICFSAFVDDGGGAAQVGFARVTTDRATFAYLADVFVLPSHRGRGVADRLMESVAGHPDLQGLRRWVLVTRDAHRLYAKHGWKSLASPAGYMELWDPDVYARR